MSYNGISLWWCAAVSEITPAKRKYVRLSESTWSEIEGLWEAGDATLPDLETRYSVSRRALQARFAKRKIVKGARAAQMAAAIKEEVLRRKPYRHRCYHRQS